MLDFFFFLIYLIFFSPNFPRNYFITILLSKDKLFALPFSVTRWRSQSKDYPNSLIYCEKFILFCKSKRKKIEHFYFHLRQNKNSGVGWKGNCKFFLWTMAKYVTVGGKRSFNKFSESGLSQGHWSTNYQRCVLTSWITFVGFG